MGIHEILCPEDIDVDGRTFLRCDRTADHSGDHYDDEVGVRWESQAHPDREGDWPW